VDQSPLEDIFCGAKFDASAGTKKLPEYAVRYYIDTLASHPEGLHSSFAVYCAADTSTTQNGEAQDPAADPARPGDRRSGELR
jgi:hypothetical protein